MLKGLESPKNISLGRELRKATPASGPRKPWGVFLEGLRGKGDSSAAVRELTLTFPHWDHKNVHVRCALQNLTLNCQKDTKVPK